MRSADCCLICNGVITEGAQVCRNCMVQLHVEAGETVEIAEIAEEMRDIADVLSITENTDGNIKRSMESILRIADRLERMGNGEEKKTNVFTKAR